MDKMSTATLRLFGHAPLPDDVIEWFAAADRFIDHLAVNPHVHGAPFHRLFARLAPEAREAAYEARNEQHVQMDHAMRREALADGSQRLVDLAYVYADDASDAELSEAVAAGGRLTALTVLRTAADRDVTLLGRALALLEPETAFDWCAWSPYATRQMTSETFALRPDGPRQLAFLWRIAQRFPSALDPDRLPASKAMSLAYSPSVAHQPVRDVLERYPTVREAVEANPFFNGNASHVAPDFSNNELAYGLGFVKDVVTAATSTVVNLPESTVTAWWAYQLASHAAPTAFDEWNTCRLRAMLGGRTANHILAEDELIFAWDLMTRSARPLPVGVVSGFKRTWERWYAPSVTPTFRPTFPTTGIVDSAMRVSEAMSSDPIRLGRHLGVEFDRPEQWDMFLRLAERSPNRPLGDVIAAVRLLEPGPA